MSKTILFFLLISVSTFGQFSKMPSYSSSSDNVEFIDIAYKYNSANLSYFVTQSNDTLKGYIETVKAKNALKLMANEISMFVIKLDSKENLVDLPVENIKEGYVAITYDKSKEKRFAVNPYQDPLDFNTEFAYVKSLKIKDGDKEETEFVVLVNPTFSSKIKCYQTRYGGSSSVNGGKEVSNKNYVEFNGSVIIVNRKSYKETVKKIFEGCSKLQNMKFPVYEIFSDHLNTFDKNLCDGK